MIGWDKRRGGRGLLRSQPAGATTLEFALVLPIFLLFLLGVMDIGRLLWTQATLDYATDAAARCAAVDTTQCATTSQVQTYAASRAFGMTLASSAFSVTSATCGWRVSASTPFSFVTPWIYGGSLTLVANACYPTEPTS
ncbi:MAG: TadE/TadG family type IV pilus assembly protein [Caulobacteraceae bacterium]|nr:TadE/TadG family type IV pilus assembly protein [Caulobacteraceae bacterium]